jgi:hypothetical protein
MISREGAPKLTIRASMSNDETTRGLSTGQLQLARRCAWISAQCEVMEQRHVPGDTATLLVYGVLTGHLARAFRSIGLERRLPTLSLTDYVAAVHEAEPDTDRVVVAKKDEDG